MAMENEPGSDSLILTKIDCSLDWKGAGVGCVVQVAVLTGQILFRADPG